MTNIYYRGVIMEFFLASGIYNGLGKLLATIGNNLQPSTILYIALAVSLLIIISISITTSRSYEVKLIKAIDYLNEFFVANPQIDEDNLIAFNEKMKEKRIPKILRKQWQQYMLYREHKASYYMSFKQCVENPLAAKKARPGPISTDTVFPGKLDPKVIMPSPGRYRCSERFFRRRVPWRTSCPTHRRWSPSAYWATSRPWIRSR